MGWRARTWPGEGVVLEVAWVGVDVGKAHHWVVAENPQGRVVLSRRVANDQQEITRVVGEVGKLAGRLVWTVDLTTAEAALLLAVLFNGGQTVRYLSGRAVNQAAASYRGEGKTDARDAHVIADQARMRRDLPVLRPNEDLVAELRLLVAQRADLVGDRTRTLNRLRQHLTAVCPALERAAEPASQGGWLVLLARYQRPAAIRRAGVRRLRGLLAAQGVRAGMAQHLAETAVAAAKTQSLRLAGEEVAAELVAALAQQATDLGLRMATLDRQIASRFGRHRLAKVIWSMPGFGFRLGELLVAIGDLDQVDAAVRLAAYAGLAPVANDSGKRTGRRRRPVRYNRALRRAMYLAALVAIRCDPAARAYYQPTNANAPKVSARSRRPSAWPAAAPTCCGHCCATKPGSPSRPPSPTTSPRRLDNIN
jgi:transposase